MCDKPLLSCDEMPSKRVIFRSHAYGGRNGGASAIGVWIFRGGEPYGYGPCGRAQMGRTNDVGDFIRLMRTHHWRVPTWIGGGGLVPTHAMPGSGE